jgi:hypothetical protein
MKKIDRVPEQPFVHEEIVSNVWFHTMMFEKAGDFKMGHKHNFDHAHLVCSGSVDVYENVYVDGMQGTERKLIGTYKQGDIILVENNKSHTVIAKEDNTFAACIQALRDNETEEIISTFTCSDDSWNPPAKIKL